MKIIFKNNRIDNLNQIMKSNVISMEAYKDGSIYKVVKASMPDDTEVYVSESRMGIRSYVYISEINPGADDHLGVLVRIAMGRTLLVYNYVRKSETQLTLF